MGVDVSEEASQAAEPSSRSYSCLAHANAKNSRSYVMHAAVPSRMSRSAASVKSNDRPSWNQRLATSNPNWPDSSGKPRRPKGMRGYLSRPQSMADLTDHYRKNPGFADHRKRLKQADTTFNSHYSQDRLEV